jgi:hypothetical protein
MLESIVDLLGDLLLSTLILLIGSCIVGSMVVALRAVRRGAAQHPLPLPSAAPVEKSFSLPVNSSKLT